MTDRAPLLARGMRAPDFVLPGPDGTPTRFYAHAGGRPTVLIHTGTRPPEELASLAAALAESAPYPVSTHLLAPSAPANPLPLPVLVDTDGAVARRYGADTAPAVFVLDPNLRVLTAFEHSDATIARILAALPPEPGPPRVVRSQAPVMLVPDVLDVAEREEIIGLWQAGNTETGVERSAAGGRADALRPVFKRRRDHTVTDPDVARRLTAAIGRRVMPELQKAFAFRGTRFEGFKIGCYDASGGGFFRPHRDNLSPTTAHRRFALTLNLNDGYEGGQLRFPEYGPDLYRPDAGAALLFSCSHLHEVLDVTAGRRFVLLSFLYGDQDARGPAAGGGVPSPTG